MKKLGIKKAVEYINLKASIENEELEQDSKLTTLSYFCLVHEQLPDMFKQTFAQRDELELSFTLPELQMRLAAVEIENTITNFPVLKSFHDRKLITIETRDRIGNLYTELSFKPGLSVSGVKIRCKPQCYILSNGFEDYHLMLSDLIKGEREFITQGGLNRKGFNRFFREVENYLISLQNDTRFA